MGFAGIAVGAAMVSFMQSCLESILFRVSYCRMREKGKIVQEKTCEVMQKLKTIGGEKWGIYFPF